MPTVCWCPCWYRWQPQSWPTLHFQSLQRSSESRSTCIRVGHPAAALIRCNEKIFLAIVNVTGLKLGDIDVPDLELKYLGDKTSKVDIQVLRIVPITKKQIQNPKKNPSRESGYGRREDIHPTGQHDGCWLPQIEMVCKNVPGRLVCAINATMLIRKPGETTYVFVSTSLLALAGNLNCQLSANIHFVSLL